MPKLVYILAIAMLALSSYSFADEEVKCPEGKMFDTKTETCIDTPAEMPETMPEEVKGE